VATQGFNAATRFVGLPRLHFANFVVFDAKCLKRPLSKLVLECAIDGPIAPFLRDLDRHRDLSRVFRHCQEYARAEKYAAVSPGSRAEAAPLSRRYVSVGGVNPLGHQAAR